MLKLDEIPFAELGGNSAFVQSSEIAGIQLHLDLTDLLYLCKCHSLFEAILEVSSSSSSCSHISILSLSPPTAPYDRR
jgi:hypothetical protein